MLTAMDDAIGMVVRAAKHASMWQNSLLLFCSDNGARLGDSTGSNHPFRGGKFTLWEGGTRILAFFSGPLVAALQGSRWHGMAHASDMLPTLLGVAGIALPRANRSVALDGFDLWRAIRQNRSSPRHEILHNLLTRWNHRDCRGADLDEENCGAGIRIGKYKLLAGYPGDSRWSRASLTRGSHSTRFSTPRGPQMPWDYKRFGTAVWRETRKDGCNLATGIGCPCWRGYCLFDLDADPGERIDLSTRLPHVTRRLLARLEEASSSGTQGVHLCHGVAASAKRALSEVLARHHAYLPFVAEGAATAWHDDRDARSCYNPCPLQVALHDAQHSWQSRERSIPAWCATLDRAVPRRR